MDRAERPVRRWPWTAAAILIGMAAAVWVLLPDGGAARVERRADCYDPAAGAPAPLTLFNTHRNSREPAKVGIARAEAAHVTQTRENDALLTGFGDDGAMIAAGDFNNYRAGDHIGRFANDPAFRLVGKGPGMSARAAPMTDTAAWTQAYDLLGFRSSDALRVEPLAVATLFDGKNGPRLSDHDAQYIVFRLSWRGDAAAMPVPVPRCSA